MVKWPPPSVFKGSNYCQASKVNSTTMSVPAVFPSFLTIILNALFSSLGHPDIPIKAKPRECRRNIPLPFPSVNFNFHPWIYSVQCIHSFTVHSVDRSNRNLFNFIRKNHAETVLIEMFQSCTKTAAITKISKTT